MSVYVDWMQPCIPNRRWRWSESCHLLPADRSAAAERELHDMARRIGLKLEWFQVRASMPHYDLARGMRARAVRDRSAGRGGPTPVPGSARAGQQGEGLVMPRTGGDWGGSGGGP